MKPIHKFILHVVHNWTNELNEAYSEGAIKAFIAKFREEADDLNINISDEQLKKYIERFDVLKNSPKITEKDLNKYNVGQLIRLVTASPGAETVEDEEDQTPDVVYNEGGITIWNGSKEGNCITYGRGEKWCITRGSFGSYRYDSSKGYPTFYLAKNNSLPTSDKLSFVAIQVRDVDDENKKYAYTNRQNNPYESRPMGFSGLMSEIPWLNNIPNIRSILKYIPLSSQEKTTTVYSRNPISIREWIKLPFNVKKQYLVARKNTNSLFSDVYKEEFVSNYLPKYPELANFIAITPGVVDPRILLKHLDKFNNQDRRSITANLHDGVNIAFLSTNEFPFDVKKLITILKKWNIPASERVYVTKDGSTIVKLKFGDEISVSLYQAEDDYPNIRLNKRTAKYLLDYPELDQLPFDSLLKLATDDVIDKEFLTKVIEKAKTEENSAIILKKVEGGEILVDSNSLTAYKIVDGNITKIPFNGEEVQKVLEDEKDNTSFQQSVVSMIRNSVAEDNNIPPSIDKEAFLDILKSTPYDKRNFYGFNGRYLQILIPDGESESAFFMVSTYPGSSPNLSTYTDYHFPSDDWRNKRGNTYMREGDWRAYFAYLRNENQVYNSADIIRGFRGGAPVVTRKDFFRAQPPLSPTDQYAAAVGANGVCYLVNKATPRNSYKISDNSGKLVAANIPASMARQLTGATPDQATPVAGAQPAVGAPRRGRPAGVPNAPRAAVPAADAGGDINVSDVMEETGLLTAFLRLPRSDYRRLNVTTGVRVNPNGDRGAARRNNQLGGAGRVGRVIGVGPSKIYIIRLANQQIIASINIQPGNRNYILFGNAQGNVMIPMNSPAELMQVLRQRNLAEVRNYMVREYLHNNPQHLDEVREMIKKHISETQKQ